MARGQMGLTACHHPSYGFEFGLERVLDGIEVLVRNARSRHTVRPGPTAHYHEHMAMLHVHVTPRASRDTVAGFDDAGRLKVRVTAPPAEGAANEAVTKLLAKALRIPPRDIILVRGATSREKHLEVPLEATEIQQRLGDG